MSSQLGYIVFLRDENERVTPVVFKYYKSRRVTRSAMSGEFIALAICSTWLFPSRRISRQSCENLYLCSCLQAAKDCSM